MKQARLLLEQLDATLIDTLSRPRSDCRDMSQLSRSLLSITPAQDPELLSDVALLHEFVEERTKQLPQDVALEWTTDIPAEHIPSCQCK